MNYNILLSVLAHNIEDAKKEHDKYSKVRPRRCMNVVITSLRDARSQIMVARDNHLTAKKDDKDANN